MENRFFFYRTHNNNTLNAPAISKSVYCMYDNGHYSIVLSIANKVGPCETLRPFPYKINRVYLTQIALNVTSMSKLLSQAVCSISLI